MLWLRRLLFLTAFCSSLRANAQPRCAHSSDDGDLSVPSETLVFNGLEIPINESLEISCPLSKGPLAGRVFESAFLRIEDLDPDEAQFLRNLKAWARPKGKAQREVAGFFLRYAHQKSKKFKYTSNELNFVSEEASERAIAKSGHFHPGRTPPAGIALIHTHPDMGTQTQIYFTDRDLASGLDFKHQLEQIYPQPIVLHLILLPNCEQCSDLYLVTQL